MLLIVSKYIAKTCNFGTLHESLIRYGIVFGIRDNDTRRRLLEDRKLGYGPKPGQGERTKVRKQKTQEVNKKECKFCALKHEMI